MPLIIFETSHNFSDDEPLFSQLYPAFGWEDAEWLCSAWDGPVAIKVHRILLRVPKNPQVGS